MRVYGVITKRGEFIETSTSDRGAKNYATQNGYSKIGYRYEYYVTETHEKINGKWRPKKINI